MQALLCRTSLYSVNQKKEGDVVEEREEIPGQPWVSSVHSWTVIRALNLTKVRELVWGSSHRQWLTPVQPSAHVARTSHVSSASGHLYLTLQTV